MRRLPELGFGALVVATAAAFFIEQHLKTTTPLIAGPRVDPAAINPLGARCASGPHDISRFSFYLLHSADRVNVEVVQVATGHVVRTLARGRAMRAGVRHPDGDFAWDGRLDGGGVAPDGTYLLRVGLIHQERRLTLSSGAAPLTVTVLTSRPRPRVRAIVPPAVARGAGSVLIRYSVAGARPDDIANADIFSRGPAGQLHLVRRFRVAPRASGVTWNLKVAGRAAPPGIYLIGLDVVDPACNSGRFPAAIPPAPGEASGAYVTIRP